MNKPKLGMIVVAGGSGSRMGSNVPKQYLKICGKEILLHTLNAVIGSQTVSEIVVVCHNDYQDFCCDLISKHFCGLNIRTAIGGDTRQQSVMSGLLNLKDSDYVLIHDAVRCCIDSADIKKIADYVVKSGSCALGVRVKDTIKKADSNGFISSTPDREYLWQIQTPQAFPYDEILKAHKLAEKNGVSVTDDCALAETYIGKVRIIEGSYENIKVTTPSDMDVAELYIKKGGECNENRQRI